MLKDILSLFSPVLYVKIDSEFCFLQCCMLKEILSLFSPVLYVKRYIEFVFPSVVC